MACSNNSAAMRRRGLSARVPLYICTQVASDQQQGGKHIQRGGDALR